jgi:O-6-methylguanine DNA methyltransferase
VEKAIRLYQIVSQVPKGKVTTYRRLADLSGIKNARVVGDLLHKNPDPEKTPCHRVVNKKGETARSYAFGGRQGQIKRLLAEKVEIIDGKVNLAKYLWRPDKL